MLWFFERQQRRLHYEIRRQTDGDDYEIVIHHPDGRLELERYSDPTQVLERSASLQMQLMLEGWAAPPPRPR
jgi:hypothetical protein